MTDTQRVPEFGEQVPGMNYVRRPGSYGLIFDERGRVCLLRTGHGYFIPGGGANAGETEEETLDREIREECGCTLEIVRRVGVAIQHVLAEGEGAFTKVCTFFEVKMGESIGKPVESDHALVWLSIGDAIDRLAHESQGWAIDAALHLR